MNRLTARLVAKNLRVIRLDFDYMAQAKRSGKNRPPSRVPKLVEEFRQLAEQEQVAFVGGKSLGGRVASLLATQMELKGWVAFGYPYHPPGQPDKLRTDHLGRCRCPGLICQGERDTFGKREEVEAMELPDELRLAWMTDGDHQFKPRKYSSATLDDNLEQAAREASHFICSALCEEEPLRGKV